MSRLASNSRSRRHVWLPSTLLSAFSLSTSSTPPSLRQHHDRSHAEATPCHTLAIDPDSQKISAVIAAATTIDSDSDIESTGSRKVPAKRPSATTATKKAKVPRVDNSAHVATIKNYASFIVGLDPNSKSYLELVQDHPHRITKALQKIADHDLSGSDVDPEQDHLTRISFLAKSIGATHSDQSGWSGLVASMTARMLRHLRHATKIEVKHEDTENKTLIKGKLPEKPTPTPEFETRDEEKQQNPLPISPVPGSETEVNQSADRLSTTQPAIEEESEPESEISFQATASRYLPRTRHRRTVVDACLKL